MEHTLITLYLGAAIGAVIMCLVLIAIRLRLAAESLWQAAQALLAIERVLDRVQRHELRAAARRER